MLRRSISALMLVALTLLVLAAPALAGGWAAVTLDRLPADVRAGETLHLGFMVRQHGKTPINNVTPYLRATRPGASEILRVDAKQEGPVGHFVLDVTFPSAGTWDWQIVPEPFDGTAFAPLTVLPVSLALFVAAWIGQFIGHKIEGKKPSFFDDLRYLLIGPLFVLGVLYRRLKLAY